jgi:cytochrome P450
MTSREVPGAFDIDVSPASVEHAQDPSAVYRRLRERGPVVRVTSLGGFTSYSVTRYEEVFAGLQDSRFSKDASHLASAVGGTSGARQAGFMLTAESRHLLNTDPPDHTRLRKLVSRAFTARRVQQIQPRIQEIVDGLIDEMAATGEADLIADLAFPLSITVICELLGVPSGQRADFRTWSIATMTPATAEHAGSDAKLREFLLELIGQRRRALAEMEDPSSAPDLLSAMVVAHDESDRLSDDELVGMAILLLIAGHETTVGLIGSALLELCRRRDQRELLLGDPDLIGPAVEEFLRYEGPVQRATFRVAVEDVELGGLVIPSGSVVTMMVGSANRDPERFPDPDKLDITRETRGHVAFGRGIHMCLGALLARQEAQIAIGTLLRRFPGYALSKGEDALAYQPTVIRALSSLPVHLGPGREG